MYSQSVTLFYAWFVLQHQLTHERDSKAAKPEIFIVFLQKKLSSDLDPYSLI